MSNNDLEEKAAKYADDKWLNVATTRIDRLLEIGFIDGWTARNAEVEELKAKLEVCYKMEREKWENARKAFGLSIGMKGSE